MAALFTAANLPILLGVAQAGLGLVADARRNSLDARAGRDAVAARTAEAERRFAADERRRRDALRRSLAARRAAAAASGIAPLEGSSRAVLDNLIARSSAEGEAARAAFAARLSRLGGAAALAGDRAGLARGRNLLALGTLAGRTLPRLTRT